MLPQPHPQIICYLLHFMCAFSCKICILIPCPMGYYASIKSLRLSYSYVVKWKVIHNMLLILKV